MALDYDFWINDTLGFNLATSKDRPYQRATAPFRKEQFDSASNVGDQSLTGWWTRGQLSFHKGAGVLYHEVQANESIIERFDSALGVDPFVPGQVSPGFEFESLALTGVHDVIYVVNLLYGDRMLAMTTSGGLYQITTGAPLASQTKTAVPIAGTAPVAAITGSAFQAYLVSGKTIQKWRPGDASATTIWTKTDGLDFVGIWYAKQRLWVVDANGRWYVLDINGGTLVEADAEFIIKDYQFLVSNRDTWSLSDSPGSVYLAIRGEVYAVSVDYDASTLLPSIGAPVQVAGLPNDENVGCLGYHLGYLVMATSRGCRFALIQDGGTLAYGPRVAQNNVFDQSRRMASRGMRISLGGFFFNERGLWTFDVSQMVDTLQPAYANEVSLDDGVNIGFTSTGALNTPLGIVMWSEVEGKIWRLGSNYADDSWLSTGFHRFGTLDQKHFSSVLVRVGGTGGSIDVYRRDPSPDVPWFTDTLVGTVAYDSDSDIDLGLDSPTERIGLKFVFNRDPDDATKAPQLLGYQLKALPIPKRQRLIRVPLLLFDDESNRSGQRMLADPWGRLDELETLEKSNAVVTFNDPERGETGSAYIESIEVDCESAPAAGSGGVGGFIYLTLRKI